MSLLLTQAAVLAASAALHAPVMDEPAHLAAGISNWELGRYDLFKVNPPLVRMMAALPAVALGAKTDWTSYSQGVGARAEFEVMDDFVRANGPRIVWLVILARWALIPLVLIGGYVSYRWSRELYGDAAGIFALVLWCFCLNVLAYGQVLNADCVATALGVAASYCFWKWLRDPGWDRAVVAGIVLGLAELTKTTWGVLFALWPVLWVVVRGQWSVASGQWLVVGRGIVRAVVSMVRRTAGKFANCKLQISNCKLNEGEEQPTISGAASGNPKSKIQNPKSVQLAVILGMALFLLNAGYDFEGSGTRLRNYVFMSRPLTGASEGRPIALGNRFAKSWLGRVSLPLPRNYVEGIDLQWHDIEVGKPSYLRGCWQDRGWWYWYLYALAVKVPLGTWGLFLLAIGVRVVRWKRGSPKSDSPHPDPLPEGEAVSWRDELVLLAPAAVVLVLVSSQTGFSRYIRYVLPAFPFAFIWISSVARCIEWRQWKITVLAGSLLAWSIGSSLWYAPHWMSYFNELAGGPLGGPAHLIDAQVDWGQDLLYLKKWLDAHPEARPLKLIYFGPIDPRLAGIEFTVAPKAAHIPDDPAVIAELPSALQPGWYAISVNFLYGYPHYAPDGRGGRAHFERAAYNYFRRFQPVATAGYSIYIYHLTARDIEAARRLGSG